MRYINQRGSQENFAGGTRYTIDSDDAFAQASADRSNVAVDGAFLLWSSISQSLWELWRPGIAPTLLYREIPLQGGDTLRAPGKESKVIAFADSRFVYLRDEGQQVFTVYRSSPYKTNDAHTTDYSLLYFFSIKFTLGDVKVRDVYVEEGEKAQLYLMTANEVRRIDLG